MKDNTSSNSKVLDVLYGKFSVYTKNYNLFEIDDGFTKITGYTQQDMENGLSLLDFIPKEDVDYYVKRVTEVLSIKPECYLEHRITKKSGEKVYVLCFGKFNVFNNDLTSDIIIADVTEMVKSEEVFAEVKSMFNTVIENVPSGIAIYTMSSSENLNVTLANGYYWRKLGYASEIDFINNANNIQDIFDADSCNEIFEKIKQMFNNNISSFSNEYKILKKDGSYIWASFKFKLYKYADSNKEPILYAVMSDITETKKQLAIINYQNERYELIQTLTNEIYFNYDLSTDTMTLPKNIKTIFTGDGKGNTIKNFFEHFINEIVHPDDIQKFKNVWNEAFNKNQDGTIELRIKLYSHELGYQWCMCHYILNKDTYGKTIGLFGKVRDISENHLLRDEIKTLSTTDTITKLYNKTSFCQQLDSILPTLDVKNKCCAIISTDINDFSYINDNFGYDAGNDMLIEYANYISQYDFYILRCRIYSDFFYYIAYTDMSKEELAKRVEDINRNFTIKQKSKYPAGEVSICAGIFYIEDNSLDSIVCMDNADLARRSIKKIKFSDLAIYNQELRDKRSKEKIIPSELNEAMQQHKIEVFLQPKFDMKTFKIIGAEALSRWRNDDGSYRSPVTFIPVLEKLGYIVQLDFYIYEQVLQIMKKWKDDGIKLIPISINFSRIHNNYDNFVDNVLSLANKYGIDKSLIEIEITESAFADNDTVLLNNIDRLRSLGFKIDIDDFGIGESSLSTLLDAPVDIIKLDKKFIDNLSSSQRQQNFLKQLCYLIQTANKNIIFEGVELKEQSQFLCNCGFYMGQGWLFDKAIPVGDFEKKYVY